MYIIFYSIDCFSIKIYRFTRSVIVCYFNWNIFCCTTRALCNNFHCDYHYVGPLFTKRWDFIPPALVKSRSRQIWIERCAIALKLDRPLVPVKLKTTVAMLAPNPPGSRILKTLPLAEYRSTIGVEQTSSFPNMSTTVSETGFNSRYK